MIQVQNPKTQQLLDTLLANKDQVVTIKTQRPVKMKKGQPQAIKISEFQCRVGADYEALQSVKDRRAAGELAKESKGLPWGEWVDFPYVITHNDEFYVRCARVTDGHKSTRYILNEQEVDKSQVQPLALSSEFSNKDDSEVFNVKLSNIVEVL